MKGTSFSLYIKAFHLKRGFNREGLLFHEADPALRKIPAKDSSRHDDFRNAVLGQELPMA
jgi:hypothetical protein